MSPNELTEEQRMLLMALDAVKQGNAGCWSTVYGIIQDTIIDLKTERAELKERCEKLDRERIEAEAALWRIAPDVYSISPDQSDPFEGPGETYYDAYQRLGVELQKAKKALSDMEDKGLNLTYAEQREGKVVTELVQCESKLRTANQALIKMAKSYDLVLAERDRIRDQKWEGIKELENRVTELSKNLETVYTEVKAILEITIPAEFRVTSMEGGLLGSLALSVAKLVQDQKKVGGTLGHD
jgi:chromosome segregation ATPase